jgi:hypothetical protein
MESAGRPNARNNNGGKISNRRFKQVRKAFITLFRRHAPSKSPSDSGPSLNNDPSPVRNAGSDSMAVGFNECAGSTTIDQTTLEIGSLGNSESPVASTASGDRSDAHASYHDQGGLDSIQLEGAVSCMPPMPIMDPDTNRAYQRYENAKRKITDSLKIRRNDWESFDFPQLNGHSEQEELSTLRSEINNVLESRKRTVRASLSTWSKSKAIVENFTAISPFAKNFLTVAKDAQQVKTVVAS